MSAKLEDRVETLEANVLEQEHRLITSIVNFVQRNKWPKNSEKRSAVVKALFWNLLPKAGPVAAGVTIISLITVYLAYQANLKIENQNILMAVQNELQESQRRSSLNIEISAIMDKINDERNPNYEKGQKDSEHTKKGHKVAPYILSDITAARIAAISRSLKPYRNLKIDNESIEEFRQKLSGSWSAFGATPKFDILEFMEKDIHSPEREQLFVALQTMRISFSNIGRNSDFSYVILKDLDLGNSDFRTVRLQKSRLDGSRVSYSIFDGGVYNQTSFKSVNGTSSTFIEADLKETDFSNSSISGVDFSRADLSNSLFIGATYIQANFSGATMSGVDLTNSNVSGSDFTDVEDFNKIKFNNTLIEGVKGISPELLEYALKNGATDDWSSYNEKINKINN